MRAFRFMLASTALLACDGNENLDPALDEVALDEVFFDVTAESSGERLVVGASLRLADYHQPLFEKGDALRIATDDAGAADLVQAVPEDGENVPDNYAGSLVTAATAFTLTLSNGESAVSGKATLPEPFTLTAEMTPLGIQIDWPPSVEMPAPGIVIRIYGPCVQLFERVVAQDVGTYLIQPAELAIVGPQCDVAVSLSRSRDGVLEGITAGQGTVKLTQTRTANVQVTK